MLMYNFTCDQIQSFPIVSFFFKTLNVDKIYILSQLFCYTRQSKNTSSGISARITILQTVQNLMPLSEVGGVTSDKCQTCKSMFKQAKHLQGIFPPTKRNCETCMFCEKFSHNGNNMQKHTLVHNGETLFLCGTHDLSLRN